MSEEEKQYVEIYDEDNNIIKCEIIDVIDFEDKVYALLLPLENEQENDADETEVIILEYIENGDEGYFQNIENEEEFNRVSEYIYALEDEDE